MYETTFAELPNKLCTYYNFFFFFEIWIGRFSHLLLFPVLFLFSLIIPRAGKVMSIIFVVLSRMSPTLEFEYHECAARVVFSSVGDRVVFEGLFNEQNVY
jgi:hypothetical protein